MVFSYATSLNELFIKIYLQNSADHARLSKPSGSASPATVSSHHASTISTVPHMAAPSVNSGIASITR